MYNITQTQYIKKGWDYKIFNEDNEVRYYFEMKRFDGVYDCHQLIFSNNKNLQDFLDMLDTALKHQNKNILLNEIDVKYDEKPTKPNRKM